MIICKDCGKESKPKALGRCRKCYDHLRYMRDRETFIRQANEWAKNNPTEYRERMRRHHERTKADPKKRERKLETDARQIKRWRQRVLEAYGNKCVRCGFDDWRALQIDHISGHGGKEIKSNKYIGSRRILYYKKVIQDKDKGIYQLLCANCNWIKRYENNEMRKPKKVS